MSSFNVMFPSQFFSLGTLTAHCLTDVCMFACRFTSELGLRVYSSVIKYRSEDKQWKYKI
jgi:hypothetical protein